MHRRVHLDRLPRRRTVVRIDFRGARQESFWLVMDPADVSVCLHDPGFDVDLLVTADLATLYRVYAGRLPIAEAMRCGLVELDGRSPLVQAFWSWFAWSAFAEVVRSTLPAAPATV
jgi:hypothetical protein